MICISSEDTYGFDFLKELFKKCYSLEVSRLSRSAVKFKPCDSGLERKLKASTNFSKCGKILLFVDADGKPVENVKESLVLRHLSDEKVKEKVHVIVFETEIEELIVYSLTGRKDQKPSRYLKENIDKNYDKYRLQSYAEKVDCEKIRNLNSIKILERIIRS